jgi:hypothetical protein
VAARSSRMGVGRGANKPTAVKKKIVEKPPRNSAGFLWRMPRPKLGCGAKERKRVVSLKTMHEIKQSDFGILRIVINSILLYNFPRKYLVSPTALRWYTKFNLMKLKDEVLPNKFTSYKMNK